MDAGEPLKQPLSALRRVRQRRECEVADFQCQIRRRYCVSATRSKPIDGPMRAW